MSETEGVTNSVREAKSEIDTALGLLDANRETLAHVLLQIVDRTQEEHRAEVLRHVCEQFEVAESSGELETEEVISESRGKELAASHGDLIDKMLDVLLRKNLPEDEFYDQLYQLVANPILDDDVIRGFALFWILIDDRIPYFHLDDGLRMSNDDWKALSTKTRTERARIRFILNTSFSQKSEKADLVLKEIDSASGEERVALMSTVIQAGRRAGMEEIRSVLSGVLRG